MTAGAGGLPGFPGAAAGDSPAITQVFPWRVRFCRRVPLLPCAASVCCFRVLCVLAPVLKGPCGPGSPSRWRQQPLRAWADLRGDSFYLIGAVVRKERFCRETNWSPAGGRLVGGGPEALQGWRLPLPDPSPSRSVPRLLRLRQPSRFQRGGRPSASLRGCCPHLSPRALCRSELLPIPCRLSPWGTGYCLSWSLTFSSEV